MTWCYNEWFNDVFRFWWLTYGLTMLVVKLLSWLKTLVLFRSIVNKRGISEIVRLFKQNNSFNLNYDKDDLFQKVPKSEEFSYNTRLQKNVVKTISMGLLSKLFTFLYDLF